MELKKKGIIIGILLLWLLPLIVSGTTYTPSSETTCDSNGKCTLVQYSGIRYVQEDDSWKKLEDARSLMDKGFSYKYIETDEKYPMEVIDFNFTSVTVNLNPKGIVIFNEAIPLKTWTEPAIVADEEKVVTGDFKLDYDKTTDTLVDFNLFKQSDTITLDVKMGDIIEFGTNSTTILLTADDTENLKDTYDDSNSATTNFGTGVTIHLGVSSPARDNRSILIQWNLSSIPAQVAINNASLVFSVALDSLDAGESFNTSAFYVYPNYTWTETGEIWNTRPLLNKNYTETIFSDNVLMDTGFAAGQNISYNVSSLINKAYTDSQSNITIYVIPTGLVSGTPATSDPVQVASKEQASTPTRQPRLYIEYTSIAPSSCTYTSGNWNINTHDNCTISTNVNLGGNNLTLNGSGTIMMNANITNKGTLIMSNGSKFVLANGVRLG